jgi:hypothetical protein
MVSGKCSVTSLERSFQQFSRKPEKKSPRLRVGVLWWKTVSARNAHEDGKAISSRSPGLPPLPEAGAQRLRIKRVLPSKSHLSNLLSDNLVMLCGHFGGLCAGLSWSDQDRAAGGRTPFRRTPLESLSTWIVWYVWGRLPNRNLSYCHSTELGSCFWIWSGPWSESIPALPGHRNLKITRVGSPTWF